MPVVVLEVVDVIPDVDGVEQHPYHGMLYVRAYIRKCAPGNDTTSVNKDNREGELRVVTRGCVDEKNGSYVTVRLRNSIDNCNYIV